MALLSRRLFSSLNKNAANSMKLLYRSIRTQSAGPTSSAAYDGDGKTKVNILNRELDLGLMINSYSQYGFRLNNDFKVVGPMAIFPR